MDGIAAIRAMATYHVAHKGWGGIGYHYAIPKNPVYDPEYSRLVMFQVAHENTVRAHTRGCNRFGTGLVLQGHLGRQELTDYQKDCLKAFLPWWLDKYDRVCKRGLGWHSTSYLWGGIPKRACPGRHAVAWLKQYQRGLPCRPV